MRFPIIWALLLAFWALPKDGNAAEIDVQDLGDGQSMVVFSGDIERGDSVKFRRAAAQLDEAIVVLESEGGSTIEAIEIGETIRIKGFSTIVFNDAYCASACGLIWLAGSPRALTKSARVGFHATYTDEAGAKLESGVGNALVGRYFAILNLPRKAIVFATSAPPNRVNWLSPANAALYGVEVNIVDDFESDDKSADQAETSPLVAPPPPFIISPPPFIISPKERKAETTLWTKFENWSVIIDHTLGDSCFMIRSFDDGTTFRLGLDVKFDKGSYIMIANRDWASIEIDKIYPITIQLDAEEPWEANTKGMQMGNEVVLHASFDDIKFWSEFATARVMRFERKGREFSKLNLGNTSSAVDQVIACQKAANEVRSERDPFTK